MSTIFGLPHEGTPGFRPGLRTIRRGLAVALCGTAAAMGTLSAPAVGPVAAEVNFDGRYGGTLTAAFAGRDGECARLGALPELVVAGGWARLEAGALAFRGVVHSGGLAVLAGALDGPAMLTGRFEGGRFLGELRGGSCTYELALVRRS